VPFYIKKNSKPQEGITPSFFADFFNSLAKIHLMYIAFFPEIC